MGALPNQTQGGGAASARERRRPSDGNNATMPGPAVPGGDLSGGQNSARPPLPGPDAGQWTDAVARRTTLSRTPSPLPQGCQTRPQSHQRCSPERSTRTITRLSARRTRPGTAGIPGPARNLAWHGHPRTANILAGNAGTARDARVSLGHGGPGRDHARQLPPPRVIPSWAVAVRIVGGGGSYVGGGSTTGSQPAYPGQGAYPGQANVSGQGTHPPVFPGSRERLSTHKAGGMSPYPIRVRGRTALLPAFRSPER